MNGLDLSEQFFFQEGLPAIKNKYPDIEKNAAFGLCGEGSDCFGYDDEISRDHDWGPGFCIWLEKPVFDRIGAGLKDAYRELPGKWKGFETRTVNGNGRAGVFEIGRFYKKFTELESLPRTNMEWWYIHDFNLAAATNGRVFFDKPGIFSELRKGLMNQPEELWIKRIAEYALRAGQSGQYNYYRALKRGDRQALLLALARFSESAMQLIYCLNRRYPPYYKWLHRGLGELEILGRELRPLFYTIGPETDSGEIIEMISARIITEIRSQDLSSKDSDFLPDHLQSIHERIGDRQLASIRIEP